SSLDGAASDGTLATYTTGLGVRNPISCIGARKERSHHDAKWGKTAVHASAVAGIGGMAKRKRGAVLSRFVA
ncbi:unnamed protein product, partial [Ectocarpus sp. 13 AM-2016]